MAQQSAKHPFDYHRPSANQVALIEDVRGRCKDFHTRIVELRDSKQMEPRAAAVAITKLEELSMWANKGIILAEEGPVEHPPAGLPGHAGTRTAGMVTDGQGGWTHQKGVGEKNEN